LSGSSVDPTRLYAFGHGLSYTTFEYPDLVLSASEISTDGTVEISCTVRNTMTMTGTEVVQLYLCDPVAQAVRPVRWLAGFAQVPLAGSFTLTGPVRSTCPDRALETPISIYDAPS
jgi:beta-xylosidase